MSVCTDRHSTLRRLLRDAFDTCVLLKNYTDEHFSCLCEEDDEEIIEVIENREIIIEKLMDIEHQIDVLLDEAGTADSGLSLPNDIEELQLTIRKMLSEISARDLEFMTIISSKMQEYRNETLKARNKKSLTAYMNAAFVDEPGDSIDFSK